jgi:hypothetical protein
VWDKLDRKQNRQNTRSLHEKKARRDLKKIVIEDAIYKRYYRILGILVWWIRDGKQYSSECTTDVGMDDKEIIKITGNGSFGF